VVTVTPGLVAPALKDTPVEQFEQVTEVQLRDWHPGFSISVILAAHLSNNCPAPVLLSFARHSGMIWANSYVSR
jgi:hypothetical protein